jgi:hypothetical protein
MKHWLIAVLLSAVAIAGCGKKDEEVTTIDTPDGKVTIRHDEDNKVAEVEIKGEDGKSSMAVGKAVSSDEIGIAYYPGAEQAAQSNFSMQIQDEDGSQTTMAMMHTVDAIENVSDFYKQNYADAKPEISEMNMSGQHMINLVIEEGEQTVTIMLMANGEKGGTDIQLTRASD